MLARNRGSFKAPRSKSAARRSGTGIKGPQEPQLFPCTCLFFLTPVNSQNLERAKACGSKHRSDLIGSPVGLMSLCSTRNFHNTPPELRISCKYSSKFKVMPLPHSSFRASIHLNLGRYSARLLTSWPAYS